MSDFGEYDFEDKEEFRDRIATVDEDGKRKWIFPKKPSGKFYNYRKIVAYGLLAILIILPFIKMNGEPFVIFNILERKFIVFGKIFWPQDLYIFALGLILAIVWVIFFTIIFGRIFCGWFCPQTIFMEMVFRRIEYWVDGDFGKQKALARRPWDREKIFKRVAKHTLFWLVSFATANLFLSYIIGVDELWSIMTDPVQSHIGGFIAILIFSSVFYGVFAHLREQVCTTICPYGRLQGVLLDENSMVIAYDYVRGENRAKFRKNEVRSEVDKGDCIDCFQCVNVCPTGIDIRDGTQLECVNCTACIDACDDMMLKVGQEPGLIRFVSEKGIKERAGFEWTPRVKAYSALLVGLMITMAVLLITRNDFQTKILRQKGTTFQVTSDGQVSNIYEIYLLNKTRNDYDIHLELEGDKGTIETVVHDLHLEGEEELKERFVVKMPYEDVSESQIIKINVFGDGKRIQQVKTKFIGPLY